MTNLEIVMEMVAHGYHLFTETPAQFAARWPHDRLVEFAKCFNVYCEEKKED